MQRDLSTCIKARFNIFRNLNEKQMKKLFYPIDIVYKFILKITQTVDYYFPNSIRNAHRGTFRKKK